MQCPISNDTSQRFSSSTKHKKKKCFQLTELHLLQCCCSPVCGVPKFTCAVSVKILTCLRKIHVLFLRCVKLNFQALQRAKH